jgi:ubiquinone/menaquinone biosynthesis C-methylase UbiE
MTPTRYTHGHADSVLRSHRWRTAENSCGYLLPHLRPGTKLLDVGCGPGTITADLAALVTPGEVIGIDASPAVIAEARDGMTAGNLSFAVGDVDQLPFADDSFDVVHAHQVLQHLADPVAALGEMRRVCRPGGLVAARDADYAAMAWYPRLPALDDWMTLYQQVARNNGAEPDGGRHLRHWAYRAGFEEVTSSASVWCYADETDRQWWGDLWADRVVDSGLAQQALGAGLADAPRLAALADGWREWSAHPDAWFAVLNGEILCRA